jgi:hypothetical protein
MDSAELDVHVYAQSGSPRERPALRASVMHRRYSERVTGLEISGIRDALKQGRYWSITFT